jgi:hypothetical protein
MDIEDLRRIVQSDPGDVDSQIQLWKATARISGPSAYLEPLSLRKLWKCTPDEVQDLVIEEVKRRLPDFDHIGTKSWILKTTDKPEENKVVEEADGHRLATFRHKLSRIEFNLLPGKSGMNPILMSRWPMTVRQWSILCEESLSKHGGEDVGDPMVGLPCANIQKGLRKRGLRLPTGEEWLYACQAGATTYFYWGDQFDSDHVWHQGNTRMSRESVGEHEQSSHWNAFGLVDVLGNVWEWTSNVSEGFPRVMEECRGWSYQVSEWDMQEVFNAVETMAYPFSCREVHEGVSGDDIGFRAVKSIPPSSTY